MVEVTDMNPRMLMKKALQDSPLEIEVLSPENYHIIQRGFQHVSQPAYISEWRHTMGEVKYEYRMHDERIGVALKELLASGIRGGYPTCIHVHSREEAEELTRDS